jgi:hypothetical protein
MEWGDELELPAQTDSGAIERNEVTITYLSRLVAEPRPELAAVDTSLDRLLSGPPPTLPA